MFIKFVFYINSSKFMRKHTNSILKYLYDINKMMIHNKLINNL